MAGRSKGLIYRIITLSNTVRDLTPVQRQKCGRPLSDWGYIQDKQADRKWQTILVSQNNTTTMYFLVSSNRY
jgi:hypothetical protein